MLSRSFVSRRVFVSAPVRSFQTSRALAVGKEDRLHTENRAEEVDKIKKEQLRKQKEGKGHWEDELASNSESIIKADRGDIDASSKTMKELQDESAKLVHKKGPEDVNDGKTS